jgi:ABC-type Zn uptake system ZnuABC Zn-binding protein ZnuA
MRKKTSLVIILILSTLFILTACARGAENFSADGKFKVVATTTIVGDVVAQVGADMIDLHILLPIGTDPHSFDPTPQDIAKVSDSDIVFANGAGLEEFLDNLIASAGASERVVYLSEGIEFLVEDADHEDAEHHPDDANPHTWTDPKNVLVWVAIIARELGAADPDNAALYSANAQKYGGELQDLDTWMRAQVAQIPAENRKLVTDHALFGYFAAGYGFEQIGALIPGYSTLAEPTAQELAAIEDAINDLNVQAVFVGNTVNPALAERVSADTGIKLVYVYTGSLSAPDGQAPTYLTYMRYNTTAFVTALK